MYHNVSCMYNIEQQNKGLDKTNPVTNQNLIKLRGQGERVRAKWGGRTLAMFSDYGWLDSGCDVLTITWKGTSYTYEAQTAL